MAPVRHETKIRLYDRHEIPEYFWEPYIIGEYRKPGLTIKDSIRSVVELHNETFNIWTHFALFLFTIGYICQPSFDLYNDVTLHPLLCVMITICAYTFGSSFAHTFCSISQFSQHVGFMVDYYGISLYAFSCSLANLAYSFPPEWRNSWWEKCFLYVDFFGCVFAVYLSNKSRFRNFDGICKVMRVVGFLLPYLLGMSPLIYRVFTSFDFNGATYYFVCMIISSFVAVTFYATHFPECIYPRTFDIYCHSHQSFHVGVVVTTYFHLQGVKLDIVQGDFIAIDNSLTLLLCIVVLNGLMLGYHIYHMYIIHHRNVHSAAKSGHTTLRRPTLSSYLEPEKFSSVEEDTSTKLPGHILTHERRTLLNNNIWKND